MADVNFKKQIKTRWIQLRTNQLSNTRVNGMIDSMSVVVNEAQVRNFKKWPILGRYIWPNAFIGSTYDSEVSYLKGWLTNRIIWIDGQIALFPTGQKEILEKAIVYPNPSVSGFTFDYVLRSPQEVKLLIYNDLGQLIFQKTEQQTTGNQQLFWQDKKAVSGLYFYEIQADNARRMTGKVLKND